MINKATHIEFSENMNEKLTGKKGLAQLISYRLRIRKGEIPYFVGGLDVTEFSLTPTLAGSIIDVLPEFGTDVVLTPGKVTVGEVTVSLTQNEILGKN